MDHDERIIGYIAKDENISQRQLAKLSDLSLGQLNLILHKLVAKGFITIERINPRSMRYILTPKGIARNAKRTYNYIKNAFKQVMILKAEVEQIFQEYNEKGYTVYLDGDEDEIYQILHQIISENKIQKAVWMADLPETRDIASKAVVLVWQIEKEEKYKESDIEYINLLNRVDSL